MHIRDTIHTQISNTVFNQIEIDLRLFAQLYQGSVTNYTCTFENGNQCGLRQEVEDGTDWWLVPASFVRQDVDSSNFTDLTSGTRDGKTVSNVVLFHDLLLRIVFVLSE
ncbi:hypothetical protein DPMN_155966 [Dreissena polymorpha]|uniref:MAM domain-containing protein n=1 Tax=Dreissena polymorpha TaxID=45954 RepID=A0A9D4FQC8_DREPO|nr:hypothetical protein DPMN_155966 [Dreissena polymorpha]